MGCDRLVTYAFLGLQRDFMFDLSINVVDDCRRSGRGSSYFGVSKRGRWESQDDSLVFTTTDVIPTFGGRRDAGALVLRIPPNFAAVTNTAMELRLSAVETQ